jgi:hypothetical protein
MAYGENGGVIGPINTPTVSVASGVWSLGEVAEAERQGIWIGYPFEWAYSGSYNTYTNWNSTGYTYVEMYGSGNLTFEGIPTTIDLIVIGGGGGYDVNGEDGACGGGGGGGVTTATALTTGPEVIAVTIGAAGTRASSLGGTSGGTTSLTISGVNASAGGGGKGGAGGWATSNPGWTGLSGSTTGSIYRGSPGGGGGGGNWYGYSGGGGGTGGGTASAGTPSSGTWLTGAAGSGGNANLNSYNQAGGGGSGGGNGTRYSGDSGSHGGEGLRWLTYGFAKNGQTDGTTAAFFGSGGSGRNPYTNQQTTIPNANPLSYMGWGKGAMWIDGAGLGVAQSGAVIFRYTP